MPGFATESFNGSPKIASLPNNYRSITEIPEKYRHLFLSYQYFNAVQSKVMNDVLYSEKSLVVAAPTGSGKTVLFELAIVSLLIKLEGKNHHGDFKIVYLAPVKALCSERYQDWSEKFFCFGLRILEITGDTDSSEYSKLQDFNIVITTPEKWDSLTRKWKDNKALMQAVKLILIDEVHLVGDETRGPTLEAVVSRLKTVQGTLLHDLRMMQATLIQKQKKLSSLGNQIVEEDLSTVPVRFVAVSACIPNIEDVANWLGENSSSAIFHQISEEMRPVKLKKVVLGYNCQESWSPFRFSITLMYKLKNVLLSYADGKPTLIFCSTRKGVLQVSAVLYKDLAFRFTQEQREKLYFAANQLNEKKLKDFLLAGIGYHHAGMSPSDRYLVEDLFRAGFLPILVATSTLAMGVNLPAHLVIIMSTEHYVGGAYKEYPESQILQMIGRAGRPQYDSTAVAVIMTKNSMKDRYERLVEGRELLESSLHRHLTEHLNAEVVLNTVTDVAVAMDWIRSTFLYVCAARRPAHYSLACPSITTHKIESKLQELCMREMNALAGCGIVHMDGMDVRPTEMGRLMACYCVAFETMKLFKKVQGTETIIDLIKMLSKSAEYSDVQLRVSERKVLNILNKNRGHECIRYPISDRVKTKDQKINILIQSIFGCLHIHDTGLLQESLKVIRVGQRVSKCFRQYVLNCIVGNGKTNCYRLVLSALRLTKCFISRLWEDSIFVARQLDGIGAIYAGLLAASGKTSFSALRDANPRDIERILNKPPPFGNDIKDAVNSLPQYKISIEEEGDTLTIEVSIINAENLRQCCKTDKLNSCTTLIAGDSSLNNLLLYENIFDLFILNAGTVVKNINLQKNHCIKEVKAHLINNKWVGLDVEASIEIGTKHDKTQQNVRDYLKKFAFSQGSNKEGSSDNKRDEGKINSTENKKSSKQIVKKSYFDKLKERVKMLPNQPTLVLKKENLPKCKTKKSIDKYLKVTLTNKKNASKVRGMDEIYEAIKTSPQKRFKNDMSDTKIGIEDFSSQRNYVGVNKIASCYDDNGWMEKDSLSFNETQGSVYFDNSDDFGSEIRQDEDYFNHLSLINSPDLRGTSSPEDRLLFESYKYDSPCNKNYEEMDGGTYVNIYDLHEDTMRDNTDRKVNLDEKIQIPNFDLGEDDLLEETST